MLAKTFNILIFIYLVGILAAEDNNKELDLYNSLIKVMSDSSICGLGQAASNCVSHLIKYFPEEF